jgi:hypothetical protein
MAALLASGIVAAGVATLSAGDALSGIAIGSLRVVVDSNEPSNLQDEVMVNPDGNGAVDVLLRARRLWSGTGRRYSLTASVEDLAGNVTSVSAECAVPHDQRTR